MKFNQTLSFIVLTSLLFGCANTHLTSSDYSAHLRETPQATSQNQTVIFFLVDGLSVQALNQGLKQGKVKSIQNYFMTSEGRFSFGKSVFPTLTYPNIASILTSSTVDRHPIIGNKFLIKGQAVNFESPFNKNLLNQVLHGQTVFSDLSSRYLKTVSYSHTFNESASVHLGLDLESGIAYLKENYTLVDGKVLESLENLLTRTNPEIWPSFIFVHLIGVDALSHKHGPLSKQALDYLGSLDQRLSLVFKTLKQGEVNGKKTVSFLSADHGFTDIQQYSNIEGYLNKIDPRITVLNQYRLATLYFPKDWNWEKKRDLESKLIEQKGVEWVLQKRGNTLFMESHGKKAELEYQNTSCKKSNFKVNLKYGGKQTEFQCPEFFDSQPLPDFDPYFISNISYYFHSKSHPEMLVLASPHTSFTIGNLGEHGGTTLEETLVPLLMRNADIKPPSPVIATHEVLSFLNLKSQFSTFKMLTQGPPSVAAFLPVSHIISLKDKPEFTLINRESLDLYSSLKTSSLHTGDTTLSSRFEPTLGLEWNYKWSNLLSSLLGYQMDYVDFKTQNTYFRNELGLGLGYRFGDREMLVLQGTLAQQFFELNKYWIPEFGFETRFRLFSFGFGDLSMRGAMGFLFPRSVEGLEIQTGLRENMSFGLEIPVKTTDLMGTYLKIEHLSQDTNRYKRSVLSFELIFSYGLSFLD